MALVIDWQKRLGYRRDPFKKVIVEPIKRFIVGIPELQEKLSLFLIKADRFGTITGDPGSGKTTFMLWIRGELSGNDGYKVHYVDARKAKDLVGLIDTIRSVRKGISGFLKKIGVTEATPLEKEQNFLAWLKKGKHAILVDNSSELNREALELLEKVLKETPTQIIFADTSENMIGMALREPFTDRLKLKMPKYSEADLIRLLKRRIELMAGSVGVFPFDQGTIKKIIAETENNPTRFLEAAREKAIELSLKVKQRPKRVKTQDLKEPDSPKPKKKGRFFQIQIESGPPKKDKQPEKAPPPKVEPEVASQLASTVSEKPIPRQEPEEPEEFIIEQKDDAETFTVIDEEVKKKPKGRKTKHDKVIEALAGSKKPKKKTAKKIQKKAKKRSVKKPKKKVSKRKRKS